MVVFKMRDSVPSASYSSVCNVLRQWNIPLIPTYRVYRLYDISVIYSLPKCENRQIKIRQFRFLTLFAQSAKYNSRQYFRLYGIIINPRRACARVTVLVLCVCLCVCVFSLFWHLAQSGVQTAVSATSARYGHEI